MSFFDSFCDLLRVSSDSKGHVPERVRAGEAFLAEGGRSSRGDRGRGERRGTGGAVGGVRSRVGEGKGDDGGGTTFVVGVGVVKDGSLELEEGAKERRAG
jgi:hypothetical protein